jgi:hypothetical protein
MTYRGGLNTNRSLNVVSQTYELNKILNFMKCSLSQLMRKYGYIVPLIAFSLAVVVGLFNHEFWADEADAWLLARDATFGIYRGMD